MNHIPSTHNAEPADPPPTTPPPAAAASSYLVPLDSARRDDLLAALRHATETARRVLDCSACAGLTRADEEHLPRLERVRAWRALAIDLGRLPAISGNNEPLIRFDANACRAWLLAGAADEAGIDDGFNPEDLTIVAGLDELLYLLNNDSTQQVWRPMPHVHDVLIWRTADGDGADGGGVLTVDLDHLGERVRLASPHQGHDDFTGDAAASGIAAAIEALGHVADTINREYANFRRATACPPPRADVSSMWTVIGVWIGDEPVPVGVIAGRHDVSGGDVERFPQGVWATAVTAANDLDAERAAVAVMRDENR